MPLWVETKDAAQHPVHRPGPYSTENTWPYTSGAPRLRHPLIDTFSNCLNS